MTFPSSIEIPVIAKLSRQFGRRIQENFNRFSGNPFARNETVDEEILIEDDDLNAAQTNSKKPQYQHILTRNYVLSLATLSFLLFTIIIIIILSSSSSSPSTADRQSFEFIHGRLQDISICLSLFNITDLHAACLVHQGKNFFDSSDFCNQHNMTLLEISTTHERERITEETMKIFGSGGGTRLWINGMWSDERNTWLAYPRNETFFVTSEQVEKKYYNANNKNGDCIAFESLRSEVYHLSSVPCRGSHYFYCEF